MSASQTCVLLVDDNSSDVSLFTRAWEKSDCEIPLHSVADGKEAIEYLAGLPPYNDRTRFPVPMLVLLDLKLPGKSGFDILALLRKQPIIGRLPVVIVSSSSRDQDVDQAYELGANSYLVKPSGLSALSELITIIQHYWLTDNVGPRIY